MLYDLCWQSADPSWEPGMSYKEALQEQVDCVRILIYRASLEPGSGSIVRRCTEVADEMQRAVALLTMDRRSGPDERRTDPGRVGDRRRGDRRGRG